MKFPTRAFLRSNFVIGKGIELSTPRFYLNPNHAFSSLSSDPSASTTDPSVVTKSWLLQFDVGARGNPGLGGCGVVLLKTFEEEGKLQRKEVWHGFFFFLGAEGITCNYAEYQGLIYGLKTAIELKVPALQIEGDSELIIRQMLGIYQCRHPKLQKLHKEAKELAAQIPYVKYRHIPRKMNSRADELSNHAMSLKNDQNNFLVDKAVLMREIAAFQPTRTSDLPTVWAPTNPPVEGSSSPEEKPKKARKRTQSATAATRKKRANPEHPLPSADVSSAATRKKKVDESEPRLPSASVSDVQLSFGKSANPTSF